MQELNSGRRWSLAQRVGFRFLFSYLILFSLTGQEIAQIPFCEPLVDKYTELWHAVAVWIGRHLFHITYKIALSGDGSGDTTFRWLLLLCYVILAGVVTVVWSVLDRTRGNYERLHQWLRLLLRFSLAVAMIVYGTTKVIPNQMPIPRPYTLLQRVGELTPMRMLWTFMGTSPAYETFTGLAELLGGLLLLVPRTTLLGALVCVADMTMVFLLNMCYDVPVKIMSFHYLGMSLILVAPDLHRLAGLFLFNRTVEPAETPPPLFVRPRLNRAPHVLLFLLGLYVIGASVLGAIERYKRQNPPRPPLYGVWSVEDPAGDTLAGRDADPERWRWVTFQKPGSFSVETASGAHRAFSLDFDRARKRLTLGKYLLDPKGGLVRDAKGQAQRIPNWRAELVFDQPAADRLVLDGELDGRPMHATLHRMRLTGENFHWIIDPTDE
ncbi:MAG TPA: hypothetical protein VF173_08120 [Thermoanaerobaculia bacterium]|nr:hypothetical protein [Thermoanaerobaculia bacterium]